MNDIQKQTLNCIRLAGFKILCTLDRDKLTTFIRYPEGVYCLFTIPETGSIGFDTSYYSTLEELSTALSQSEFNALLLACAENEDLTTEERLLFRDLIS